MKYQGVVPGSVVSISVAEASKSFAALLQQVHLEGTEFELEEQGRIVATLNPVEPMGFREQE
jgi:antitoxin (DNA-binding transcriptional repressor) of toxin-antitoxin stability system